MSIYQEIILEHYRNPRNWGRIKGATATVTANNPLCGDVITLDVVIKNKSIQEVKFSGVGCAISKASASLLSEYIKNKNTESLIKLDKEFMIKLIGIEVGINRLKCLLLPLEALHTLLLSHGRGND